MRLAVPLALVLVCVAEGRGWALDKQGSAHGGAVAGASDGLAVSGSLMAGIALHNETYAARPDNSGLALMRYAAHIDVDLVGRRLSVPIDANLFSDRDRAGGSKLAPSELDVISGLTSTWALGPGAIEIGSRIEQDRSVDEAPHAQTYVDLRTRYLFDQTVRGALTLGWFAYNPSYYARPDNSGRALLRYGCHLETDVWRHNVSAAVDGVLFTDRDRNPVRPSELDLTTEVILRWPHGNLRDLELHVAYERDMPTDDHGSRPGYVQHFVYALAAWSFRVF